MVSIGKERFGYGSIGRPGVQAPRFEGKKWVAPKQDAVPAAKPVTKNTGLWTRMANALGMVAAFASPIWASGAPTVEKFSSPGAIITVQRIERVMTLADKQTQDFQPTDKPLVETAGADQRVSQIELDNLLMDQQVDSADKQVARFLLKNFTQLANEHVRAEKNVAQPAGRMAFLNSFITLQDIRQLAAQDADDSDLSDGDFQLNYAFSMKDVAKAFAQVDQLTNTLKATPTENDKGEKMVRYDLVEAPGADGKLTRAELKTGKTHSNLTDEERKILLNVEKHMNRIQSGRLAKTLPVTAVAGLQDELAAYESSYVSMEDLQGVAKHDGMASTLSYIDLTRAMLTRDIQQLMLRADVSTADFDILTTETSILPGSDNRVSRDELAQLAKNPRSTPHEVFLAKKLLNHLDRLSAEHATQGGAAAPQGLAEFESSYFTQQDLMKVAQVDGLPLNLSETDLAPLAAKDNPPKP